jgi:hypothetical protein
VWFQTQIKLKWFLIKSNKQISIKEVVSKGWFLSHDLKNFRTPPSWSSTPFLSLRGEAQWKLDPIWPSVVCVNLAIINQLYIL